MVHFSSAGEDCDATDQFCAGPTSKVTRNTYHGQIDVGVHWLKDAVSVTYLVVVGNPNRSGGFVVVVVIAI